MAEHLKWTEKEEKMMDEFEEEIKTGNFDEYNFSRSEKWDFLENTKDGFYFSKDHTELYIIHNDELKLFILPPNRGMYPIPTTTVLTLDYTQVTHYVSLPPYALFSPLHYYIHHHTPLHMPVL